MVRRTDLIAGTMCNKASIYDPEPSPVLLQDMYTGLPMDVRGGVQAVLDGDRSLADRQEVIVVPRSEHMPIVGIRASIGGRHVAG